MKKALLLILVILSGGQVFCQKTVPIRNLWTQPQVHISFKEYTVSFSIRDIDRALELLVATGDYTFGTKSNLDTTKNYSIELFNDLHTEYKSDIQPLIQNCMGTFLLTKGLAVVTTPKGKKQKVLKSMLMDFEDVDTGETSVYIHFYDPENHHLLFTGKMPVNMYNQDMGIDYY